MKTTFRSRLDLQHIRVQMLCSYELCSRRVSSYQPSCHLPIACMGELVQGNVAAVENQKENLIWKQRLGSESELVYN